MPESSGRFYKLMEQSPAQLHKFTCLRLIPKLKEFEDPAGELNRHLLPQLRKWLLRFDDMFAEVGYDTRILPWKKMDRCACDQEYEQRTTLIKWARAIDKDFDYESHKEAMDHFGFYDNVVFSDHDVYTNLDLEEKEEEENQKEEENVDDWNAFLKHREVLIRNFCHFNHDLMKKCLFKKKHTYMSDKWKEELIEFWLQGEYDDKKQILEFHGRLFCRNLDDYEEFLEKYEKEKKENKRRNAEEKKNKRKNKDSRKLTDNKSKSRQGQLEEDTQSLGRTYISNYISHYYFNVLSK